MKIVQKIVQKIIEARQEKANRIAAESLHRTEFSKESLDYVYHMISVGKLNEIGKS